MFMLEPFAAIKNRHGAAVVRGLKDANGQTTFVCLLRVGVGSVSRANARRRRGCAEGGEPRGFDGRAPGGGCGNGVTDHLGGFHPADSDDHAIHRGYRETR